MKKPRAIIFVALLLGSIFLSVMTFNVFSTEPYFIDTTSKKNSYAIKVDVEGTIVKNLNIRNNGPGLYATGIKIVADFVTIENCNIFDTPVGIAVWSSNNYIANCTFINCDDEGIVFFGGGHNTVENCVFYNCVDGIELQKSSDNVFINCRFLNNSHAGIDGILDNNNNNLFSSCIFYDNYFGCYFNESKDNKFINCTFLDNKIDMEER